MKTKTNKTTKRTSQASLINITGSTIHITNSKFLSPENCNVVIETPLKNLNKWDLKRLYHNNEVVQNAAEKEYNTHALKEFKNEIYSIISDVANVIQKDVIDDGKKFNLSKVAPFGDDKQNAISYALENNSTKTNYIARKLFEGVLPDEILKCFKEWQRVNACRETFRQYIFNADGNYLIGGQ